MMKKNIYFLSTLLLFGCGNPHQQKTERLNLNESSSKDLAVVVVGATLTSDFQAEAKAAGVEIQGTNTVLRLKGHVGDLNSLNIPVADSLQYMVDAPIEASLGSFGDVDQDALFIAKKEMGITELLKTNPTADGRGVIVGLIDDGISPNQSGFKVTTTGERKFLAKASQSSFLNFALTENEDGFETMVVEGKTFSGDFDVNLDGTINNWKATVSKDGDKVCLDLNVNGVIDENECKGTFAKTGEYFILPKRPSLSILAEVDMTKKELRLLQPEIAGDSHGEGVASVMAAHNQGNIQGYDGMAPGAQIVDYDLSALTNKTSENEYTIGTFLVALDWLASQRAEVVNVSYSLFYTNAQTQTFMAKAIETLVNKHNFVISFSAGNNGPGLGSLNRRLMYPQSVLVAGAHAPKKQDETVWGTTGLPEEGRVIYYSSRGPGAGGMGPTLVAPLSTLTHSSPEEGFRAFNGTSSASPALAGAATVLISAIKQEGLQVDASTVVNALRLSGKRLSNEPFVGQGYGLPQLPKALEIYRALISGQEFMNVIIGVNRGGLDGTTAQGIFAKRSEFENSTESYRVNLNGVISKLAPEETKVNLLTPIDLKYSRGIKGPKELWISVSQSRISVDVDIDEMLQDKNEVFGEIQLISKTSGQLLAIVPVTAINDIRPKTFMRQSLTVGAQEGARLHFSVPEGVKGVKVRSRLLEGDSRFLNFGVYDSDYIRTRQLAFTPEFFIATPKAGHYQVTLMMVQGTERKATVEFEIEESGMKLNTVSSSSEGIISVTNLGTSTMMGNLIFSKQSAPVKSVRFNNKTIPEEELSVGKGSFRVSLSPTASYDLSYFYSNCSVMVKDESGAYKPASNPFKNDKDTEATIKVRCVPFDLGMDVQEKLFWLMSVTKETDTASARVELSGKMKREVRLPKLEAGAYNVQFAFPLTDDRINVGTLDIY